MAELSAWVSSGSGPGYYRCLSLLPARIARGRPGSLLVTLLLTAYSPWAV